ncbi:ras-related protein Rab-38 [Latimeria chalumnae]|uniref:Ras-related protein Rab n=1 Tax=Latimeria chalumnae TaxID=7897 RepID=H3ARW4_LATCH|nr:PREDICTED: ras-related protein Rab-38-like [Latimeria chalumnae]|eukprot:XP_006003817.1 PREDICTED: ras-related protein Rab-38-like [Latimeria chalumnae]
MPLAHKEYLYKVVVLGEIGVGKTSVIRRYVHKVFYHHYRATIGVDFALKVLNWDANTVVRLQLWDIAGQERFGNMTRLYYREAAGALVVFDTTRAYTLEAVPRWKEDLDSKVMLLNGSPIPAVLLANKCDQDERLRHPLHRMDQFCKEKGFVGWFETSAKENTNLDEAVRCLVESIMEARDGTMSHEDPNVVLPTSDHTLLEERGGGCSSCAKP